MSSGPFAWTIPAPDPALGTAALIAESSQFRALCQVRWEERELNLAKRAELRKQTGMHRRRHVVTDPAERMRKLAIETGYDIRHDLFLKAPLEPWTSPHPVVGQRAYSDLMRARPGADLLESWSGERLAELEWMRNEQLVTISEDRLRVLPLSDQSARDGRKYPGAPVPDELAGYGRQLRDRADELIVQAVENLCAGKSAGRRPRRLPPGLIVSDGARLTAARICEEANLIKAARPDLDEFRYLGVETTRRRIRDLLRAGLLTELEPPRAVREGRSWKTLARKFERPPGANQADAQSRVSARLKRRTRPQSGQRPPLVTRRVMASP